MEKICATSSGLENREQYETFPLPVENLRSDWGKYHLPIHPIPVLLPGKSHGQRSLVVCSPWGRWGLDVTEQLHFHFSLSCIGEGNGNPLQCSSLENLRDGGAWWAAVYGVAQSQTQLKWLSSSYQLPIIQHPSIYSLAKPFMLSFKCKVCTSEAQYRYKYSCFCLYFLENSLVEMHSSNGKSPANMSTKSGNHWAMTAVAWLGGGRRLFTSHKTAPSAWRSRWYQSKMAWNQSYLLVFSYCWWGSQGKNPEVVCHSLLQWARIHRRTIQERSSWPR